jgi:hypothetical protein
MHVDVSKLEKFDLEPNLNVLYFGAEGVYYFYPQLGGNWLRS